ncbi:MAG TPA: holin [Mycobacterium sp.]|nr:holin [Mycobacterium sp.]
MDRNFLLDLAERAVRAGAAALLGVFVAGQTVATVDWQQAGAIVGTAVLVSVCSSLAASRSGDENPRNASFLKNRG